MYAERATIAHGPRPVSLGASLLISGGVIAALVFATPDLVRVIQHEPTIVETIPVTPDPKPIDQVKPKVQPETPRPDPIVAPDPIVPHLTPPIDFVAQNIIPDHAPPIDPGVATGTGDKLVVAEPPQPMPPLIAASIDPRYAGALQPPYPQSELRLGREGIVNLRVHIGIDGRVTEVQRIDATSDAFFEAARKQALAKWRFKPATRGDVPQESWKTMKLRFEVTPG